MFLIFWNCNMMHIEMAVWRAKKNGKKNLKFDYNLLISVFFTIGWDYRLELHCAIVNFKLMVPACLVCSIQNNLIPPNFLIIPKLGIMQSLPSRHWLTGHGLPGDDERKKHSMRTPIWWSLDNFSKGDPNLLTILTYHQAAGCLV